VGNIAKKGICRYAVTQSLTGTQLRSVDDDKLVPLTLRSNDTLASPAQDKVCAISSYGTLAASPVKGSP
jgi:hypothetical protein